MPWLLRDGEVLASAEVATTRAARRRGLLGRDEIDGALVLEPCRQVHSFGMRATIDVVWCDREGQILRIASLKPRRVSLPVLRARFVVEAEEGATERWALRVGDVVEVATERAT
jgi:hypothetical protein